ncbi:hypothetical protein XELAEV_18034123mg [Xenopus laevis]|uniref:Uncharacterized protein n=1 Tax=Xenopus laevis TaxID=8355 RepID=A0A974CL82_XENLA|nr:hypothetical protein XELAEV_18034123mg [Xenopus laevis]
MLFFSLRPSGLYFATATSSNTPFAPPCGQRKNVSSIYRIYALILVLWSGSLDSLNEYSIHSTITFTLEVSPTELHFLGVSIKYTGQEFLTTVYTKPTEELYVKASAQMIEIFLAKVYEGSLLQKPRQEVRVIPRQQLLEKKLVKPHKSSRILFISTFDANSKQCRNIVLKYWGLLGTDPRSVSCSRLNPCFHTGGGKVLVTWLIPNPSVIQITNTL